MCCSTVPANSGRGLVAENLEIGVMIETPSAAMIADSLASASSFSVSAQMIYSVLAGGGSVERKNHPPLRAHTGILRLSRPRSTPAGRKYGPGSAVDGR